MAKRLTTHPKVTMLWNTVPLEAKGDGDLLKGLSVKNLKTGEVKDLQINGLFYAIGHDPATALVRGQLECDADGYIKTQPGTTRTSVKGVFAAGDVQDKAYRQAVTSAGMAEFPKLCIHTDVQFLLRHWLYGSLRSRAALS